MGEEDARSILVVEEGNTSAGEDNHILEVEDSILVVAGSSKAVLVASSVVEASSASVAAAGASVVEDVDETAFLEAFVALEACVELEAYADLVEMNTGFEEATSYGPAEEAYVELGMSVVGASVLEQALVQEEPAH